jgi:zinc D-Ala-D-Ala dipeptidase
MNKLDPEDFVTVSMFSDFPISEDVVYGNPSHPDNHFGSLYDPNAQIWMHKDIAAVTLLAAVKLRVQKGWTLKINDCLRPVDAQEHMATKGFDPSLVSTPGSGAHPRGMAIDVEPVDQGGCLVDMGTRFDHFSTDIDDNPAARNYTRFGSFQRTASIRENRSALETAFRWAGTELGVLVKPLPQEWWDFRLTDDVVEQYAPLRDQDLPGYMRAMAPEGAIDTGAHVPALENIFQRLQEVERRDIAKLKSESERLGDYCAHEAPQELPVLVRMP